jgi:hypothetical protein
MAQKAECQMIENEKREWFRLPDEPQRAYEAFQWYLLLPAESRSIEVAYNTSQPHSEGTKKAPGSWKAYSIKHQWVERALAYDDHLTARQFFLQDEGLRKFAEARAKRAEYLEAKEAEMAQALFELAGKLLSYPTTKVIAQKDGKELHFYPAKWTISSVARILETASKLGRLSAGMPSDVRQNDFNATMSEITDSLLDNVKAVLGPDDYQKVADFIGSQEAK